MIYNQNANFSIVLLVSHLDIRDSLWHCECTTLHVYCLVPLGRTIFYITQIDLCNCENESCVFVYCHQNA